MIFKDQRVGIWKDGQDPKRNRALILAGIENGWIIKEPSEETGGVTYYGVAPEGAKEVAEHILYDLQYGSPAMMHVSLTENPPDPNCKVVG